MNKAGLIEKIAEESELSKAKAGEVIESIMDAIIVTLKKGDTVTLVGFGTFSVSERTARKGRNPKTGEAIKIKARKVPKFKPGKKFATGTDHVGPKKRK